MNTPGKFAIFTVHKAASMFLHRISKQACAMAQIPYCSPNNKGPSGNLLYIRRADENFSQSTLDRFNSIHTGCIGPMRRPLDIDLDQCFVNLHLRDPRDGLNSMFFSWTKIHPGFDPVKRQEWIAWGIDRFVIEFSDDYLDRYEKYLNHYLGHPNVTLLKYEDMVHGFRHWLELFLKPFQLSPQEVNCLYQQFSNEVDPRNADPDSHRRKILPGDFRNNLKTETIERLNQKFKHILRSLNYSIS